MSALLMTDADRQGLLEIRDLRKSYGQLNVLDGVSLDVREGEVVALIGASGSGKSTLLRCINALEDYDAGEIRLAGDLLGYRIARGGRRARLGDSALAAERTRIGMVFQSFNLFPHLTAIANVMLGLRRSLGQPKAVARETAEAWLVRVGLAEKAHHYPYQLSGGQQQRVAIARALAMGPELLLLDEVTSALDPELVGEVLAVIQDLARGGTTMLVVSHEMNFVRDVANRVAFMHGGAIAELGPPNVILRRPETPQLKSFVAHFRDLVVP